MDSPPDWRQCFPKCGRLIAGDMTQAQTATIIKGFGTHWTGRFQTHPLATFGMKDDGPQLIEPVGTGSFDFGD